MLIKPVSDFHSCFWRHRNRFKQHKFQEILEIILPPCDTDRETVLCCAGDMGLFARVNTTYKPLLEALSKRFYQVLVISGNHTFYDSNFYETIQGLSAFNRGLPDTVHYLENSCVELGGIHFIGSCLWTDFNKDNYHSKCAAAAQMNDYACIYQEGHKLISPDHIIQHHRQSVTYITDRLAQFPVTPTVILTHHAPSVQSSHPAYLNSKANFAYYTDLEDFILQHPQIRCWVHGHMHTNSDYHIGNTRILCNPYGYYRVEENPGFLPNLLVEV